MFGCVIEVLLLRLVLGIANGSLVPGLGAEAPDTGVGSQTGVETEIVGIQVDIRDQVDFDNQSR